MNTDTAAPARFAFITFLQNDEAREIVDRLTRTEGVVVRGATDETIAETIAHLREWDYGDDDLTVDDLGLGSRDEVVERDGYLLSWNTGLGYVGLHRRL